jgi:hypothetical protein
MKKKIVIFFIFGHYCTNSEDHIALYSVMSNKYLLFFQYF